MHQQLRIRDPGIGRYDEDHISVTHRRWKKGKFVKELEPVYNGHMEIGNNDAFFAIRLWAIRIYIPQIFKSGASR